MASPQVAGDYDASDSTSSASESSVEVQVPVPRPAKRKTTRDAQVKKRKSTYYLRKDEIESLQDQVKSLQEKLHKYERETPPATTALAGSLMANSLLSQGVVQSSLALAGTQSMVSAYNLSIVQSTTVVPLKDYIHLPVDLDQRAAVLNSLYERKLHATVQFMTERTRFLDLRVASKHLEHFDLPDGQSGVITMDVAQFNGGHSVRQVYEALMDFVNNQEISVSEKLGILTIRESDDTEEFKFCQSRLLSSLPGGVEVESNIAMFGTCVDATADSPAFALGAMDSIDQDDRYPYRPQMCLRKEVTGAITVNEIPSLSGGKPTIAMARWSYVRLHPPSFPVSEQGKASASHSMLQWCDLIPKIMAERLSTIPPAC
jgi:hypothetical protein